jgi:hypothetical protein
MNNKDEVPQPIKEAIDNFIVLCSESENGITEIIDEITQHALEYKMDEDSAEVGPAMTFYFMRQLKTFLLALKPYAQ